MSGRKRTAVLISGRGSNMQALIEAARDEEYPAEIVLVISNRPKAGGLALAKAEGIATATINHSRFKSRSTFENKIHKTLVEHEIELVACAGFMRRLTAGFVDRWHGRIINIHPSLLPGYKGLNTHERVLADGALIHGCSVHFVTADLDSGPVILQGKVPVLASDTPETLAARVLEQEHLIYPRALAMVARGEAGA